MYKIGEFSYLCECTMKTLRHYDKIGILIPKKTLEKLLSPYLENYDVMCQNAVLDKLNSKELKELICKFSSIYQVSNEMMENRLRDLGYLNIN